MKRPLSIVLAEAFDRAAHDLAMAEQIHDHENAAPPTKLENLTYWCRGFAAGWAGDHKSVPLMTRAIQHIRRGLARPPRR